MSGRPDTHYARNADGLHIAYQVVGDGPLDLLFNVGLISNVEAAWDVEGHARFFDRLASFSRLIRFDKRGSGLSDPITGPATLEERTDDMRTVLDAVGSERAVLLGVSEGGAMACLFAAMFPQRTSALVLLGTGARVCRADDYPCGLDRAAGSELVEAAIAGWGQESGPILDLLAPSVAHDERLRQLWARYERQAASPGQFAIASQMNLDIDIRSALPAIQAPTLVLHREGDLLFEACHARYLAEAIAGAELRMLPGSDHMFWAGDVDGAVDEIEEFLVGARRTREPDRILTTVLFTDIVDSTRMAADLGDRGWRMLLDRHDAIVREKLGAFGGREVKATGDGFLAVFDGPARGIRCAGELSAAMQRLDLKIRAGLHTGECEVRGADLGGLAVHIAARIGSLAGPDEVLVSSTVKDLVIGSGIAFEDRGEHELKGVPGSWRVFAA